MKLTELTNAEYQNIQEKTTLKIKKSDSAIISKLTQIYKESARQIYADTYIEKIKRITALYEKMPYTKEDITSMCFSIANIENSIPKEKMGVDISFRSGQFLTDLINIHYAHTKQNEPYVIITEPFNDKVNYLCERLDGAIVHIQGSSGYCTCQRMFSGTVIVRGNVESGFGFCMQGGTVEIEGNAENGLGDTLHDGTITIHGDAGENIGDHMDGGTIHLFGTYESISPSFISGKIYHKNKCIESKWQKRRRHTIKDIKSSIKNNKHYFKIEK